MTEVTDRVDRAAVNGGARFVAIDVLKALAALTVVAIHATRPVAGTAHTLDLGLARAFNFAVPAFLFCSGFLLQTRGRLPWTTTRRRLARLALPYALASALALAYRSLLLDEPVRPLRDLLLGNAFGHYYYVFVIFGLVLLCPLLSQLTPSARRIMVAAYVLLGAHMGGSVPDLPFLVWIVKAAPLAMVLVSLRAGPGLRAALITWLVLWGLTVVLWMLGTHGSHFTDGVALYLRNPAFHWCHFLLGWEIRAWHRTRAGALPRRRLRLLFVPLAALASALLWWGFRAPNEMLAWPRWLYSTTVILMVLSLTGLGSRRPSRRVPGSSTPRPGAELGWVLIKSISDASYTIYLFHLFAVLPLETWLPLPPAGISAIPVSLTYWVAGLGLCALLTSLAQRVPWLGPWLGARPRRTAAEPQRYPGYPG